MHDAPEEFVVQALYGATVGGWELTALCRLPTWMCEVDLPG